jgi:hypothetical protein
VNSREMHVRNSGLRACGMAICLRPKVGRYLTIVHLRLRHWWEYWVTCRCRSWLFTRSVVFGRLRCGRAACGGLNRGISRRRVGGSRPLLYFLLLRPNQAKSHLRARKGVAGSRFHQKLSRGEEEVEAGTCLRKVLATPAALPCRSFPSPSAPESVANFLFTSNQTPTYFTCKTDICPLAHPCPLLEYNHVKIQE